MHNNFSLTVKIGSVDSIPNLYEHPQYHLVVYITVSKKMFFPTHFLSENQRAILSYKSNNHIHPADVYSHKKRNLYLKNLSLKHLHQK